jgi:hypothetical protein
MRMRRVGKELTLKFPRPPPTLPAQVVPEIARRIFFTCSGMMKVFVFTYHLEAQLTGVPARVITQPAVDL